MGVETVWIIDPKTRSGRMCFDVEWVESERLEDRDQFVSFAVRSCGHANGRKARLVWGGRAIGMRNGGGHFANSEPFNVLRVAPGRVDGKLDGAQIDANRLIRFVVEENFNRQNAERQGIGLAEFFLGDRGIGAGFGGNDDAVVTVAGKGFIPARGGPWRRFCRRPWPRCETRAWRLALRRRSAFRAGAVCGKASYQAKYEAGPNQACHMVSDAGGLLEVVRISRWLTL